MVRASPSAASAYVGYQIIRRNGAVVSFEPNKIAVALMKAFLAVHSGGRTYARRILPGLAAMLLALWLGFWLAL